MDKRPLENKIFSPGENKSQQPVGEQKAPADDNKKEGLK
jgi:hypothetical protein